MKVSHQENREMKKARYRPAKKSDRVCDNCYYVSYFPKKCCTDDQGYYLFPLKNPTTYTCDRNDGLSL